MRVRTNNPRHRSEPSVWIVDCCAKQPVPKGREQPEARKWTLNQLRSKSINGSSAEHIDDPLRLRTSAARSALFQDT